MRTINSEALRYLVDYNRSCRGSWRAHVDVRTKSVTRRQLVRGEEIVTESFVAPPGEDETEALARYVESQAWLRLGVVSILGLGDDEVERYGV